jgi:hypothetical protein
MIRLTLILAVVIVVAMIVLPPDDGQERADETGTDRPARADQSADALIEGADGRLVLVTPEGEELPIDLVIEPAALTAEDAQVNLPPAEASGGVAPVRTEGGDPASEDAEVAEATTGTAAQAAEPGISDGATRLRVTGDRVNFRAGPSTEDAILASLTFGTEVELLERVGDGWAHLLVTETGLSGYMSEDFLEPAN